MKNCGFLLALILLGSSCLLAADPPAAQRAQQAQQVAPRIRVAELDRLIQVIHRDLKELRKDHPWFAKYDDKCLLDTDSERYGDSIYYATLKPKSSPMSMQPQQPDHISIGYCPAGDSGKNVRKYYNDLEDVPACQFPLWALKVGAQFKVPDEETEKAIRRCIIARCEELQKELARRLPQPHYQRQASDPAWLATVVQFHGHLGPAVVAGARMGTAGLRAVEAQGFFDVEVTCEGPLAKPPQSCFLDGVQVATGATMGKRTLQWVPADGLAVRIKNTRTGKTAVLHPTAALMELLAAFKPNVGADRNHRDNEALEAVARKIAAMPERELATVTMEAASPRE